MASALRHRLFAVARYRPAGYTADSREIGLSGSVDRGPIRLQPALPNRLAATERHEPRILIIAGLIALN